MKGQTLYRSIMLIVGLIAVSGILLSTSVSFDSKDGSKGNASTEHEQGATSIDQTTVEGIPGQATNVEDSSSSMIEVLMGDEHEVAKPVIPSEESLRYLKVLFRAIISPNAP